MIGTILQMITSELNQHLCQRLKIHSSANKVQLSAIVDPTGAITVKDNNVLLLKLINIEPDPIANAAGNLSNTYVNGFVESAPLYINLRIILAAYIQPEQIQMGLDMLSLGIGYFQGKSLWTPQNTPNMPGGVNRLVFEMESLDFNQLNHIWGAIGTKYLPSVMYKMKMIAIDDQVIEGKIAPITGIGTDANKS